jgi:hypothetical protein
MEIRRRLKMLRKGETTFIIPSTPGEPKTNSQ